ncbi:hypothetical protein [Spirochaeta isovalerica]|uniref:DNA polymerase-3 subunit gamma/tau n=1 Tax=Spirochaeta isovalerica TaxID=150 RepID=A0A841R8X9_9SPIO|nr:hypothetical protein [Spirochaeta isovalerica]MBB6479178.1 DNA polymerase-3 subunit gamma/tau [Spirochaeta isovalerica]
MFENLLEQPAVISRLTHDLQTGSLPSSILFHGPDYSGKMTAALELARALTCHSEGAPWNCSCHSCNSHRLLEHPFIIMTGGRYFYEEIAASAQPLANREDQVFRFMFVRNVRKLLRRFDNVLWEGDTSKLKKNQPQLTSVTDKIELFLPDRDLPSEKKREKLLKDILADCKKLAAAVPASTPINHIRKISAWAHRAGERKVVILENADYMQEGARNALLKILEEPPANLHFILLTTRIGAILPTIKSRVRAYGFSGRTEEQSKLVIKRIFRVDENPYHSLREFFLSHHDIDYSELKKLAELFIKSSREKNTAFRDVVPGKFEREMFIPFLEELTLALNRFMKDAQGNGVNTAVLTRIARWNSKIREYAGNFEILNQSHELLLESLYYEMKR